MQTLTVPQGAFALARYPLRANDPFRAWDSADEYLLDHLHAEGLPARDSSVLIVNDGCGALAAALATYRPQSLSDSHLAHRAALANARHNHLDPNDLRLVDSSSEGGIVRGRARALRQLSLHIVPAHRAACSIRQCT